MSTLCAQEHFVLKTTFDVPAPGRHVFTRPASDAQRWVMGVGDPPEDLLATKQMGSRCCPAGQCLPKKHETANLLVLVWLFGNGLLYRTIKKSHVESVTTALADFICLLVNVKMSLSQTWKSLVATTLK